MRLVYLLLTLVLVTCIARDIAVIKGSVNHLAQPVGCSELSPFGSLSFCFIRCTTEDCSNAKEICNTELFPDCDAFIRYDNQTSYSGSLAGQLVQLVSLNQSFNLKTHTHQVCYDLGKRMNRDSTFASEVQQYDGIRERSQELYNAKKGAMLFLHMSKNGGTTMCQMARANKVITPPNEDGLSFFSSAMGKNCNPASFQMHYWFGNREQQLDYIKNFGIQFYSNEKHLSRPDDVPFGDIMIATTLRHPLGRLFSLAKGGFNYHAFVKLNASKKSAEAILLRWNSSVDLMKDNQRKLKIDKEKEMLSIFSPNFQPFKWFTKFFTPREPKVFESTMQSNEGRPQKKSNTMILQDFKANFKHDRKRRPQKKSNATILQEFKAYLTVQNPNLDIGYFVSMRYEPPLNKDFTFCTNAPMSVVDNLGLEMVTKAKLKRDIQDREEELRALKDNEGLKALLERKKIVYKNPPKRKTVCNMTLFHLQRSYDDSDLQMAISMLNKFNYIAIFEVMDIMVPLFTNNILGWKQSNISEHRSGSRGFANEGITVLAAYPDLVNLALSTADYSLDLYRYGTRLGCYHYYRMLSKSKEGVTNHEEKSRHI